MTRSPHFDACCNKEKSVDETLHFDNGGLVDRGYGLCPPPPKNNELRTEQIFVVICHRILGIGDIASMEKPYIIWCCHSYQQALVFRGWVHASHIPHSIESNMQRISYRGYFLKRMMVNHFYKVLYLINACRFFYHEGQKSILRSDTRTPEPYSNQTGKTLTDILFPCN